MSSLHLPYRPEIDGLRAVAVMTVVLFHARLGFPGGYTGVDVFFVISGFLITGIVQRDLDQGSFSLRAFWLRRIRRLFPALCAMVLASVGLGWMVLPPSAYLDLGWQILSVLSLSSNVYFWRTTDYWALAADDLALLHMWSLAVEEQFYLGMPFLLAALHRYARRCVLVALGVLAAASLAACVHLTPRAPAAAFYLLPTRAWELLLGALVACASPGRTPARPGFARLAHAGGWCGVAMIVGAACAFDRGTPFPGWWALVPTCGATLFILSTASSGGLLRSALSHPWVRFVGMISYSLYLWHWPLLVFTRFVVLEYEDEPAVRVAVVALSILVAFLSWKYVEQPFRRDAAGSAAEGGPWWPPVPRPAAFVAGVTAMLVSGAALVAWHGPSLLARGRRSPDASLSGAHGPARPSHGAAARSLPERIGSPTGDPHQLLILGSSHGTMYLSALDRCLRSAGLAATSFARAATGPLVTDAKGWSGETETELQSRDKAVLDYIATYRPRAVMCFHNWSSAVETTLPWAQRKTAALDRKLELLTAWVSESARRWGAFGATVVIVGEVPRSCSSEAIFEALVCRGATIGMEPRGMHALRSRVAATLSQGGDSTYRYVSVSDVLEGPERTVAIQSSDRRVPYYTDDDHLSAAGADLIVDAVLRDVILDILDPPSPPN